DRQTGRIGRGVGRGAKCVGKQIPVGGAVDLPTAVGLQERVESFVENAIVFVDHDHMLVGTLLQLRVGWNRIGAGIALGEAFVDRDRHFGLGAGNDGDGNRDVVPQAAGGRDVTDVVGRVRVYG